MTPSAIYDAADTVIAQRISQVDGRGAGRGQRRRAAGDPRARQPRRCWPRWASASRRCAAPSSTPTRWRPSAPSTATSRRSPSTPTTQLRTAEGLRHHRPQDRATATSCACRASPAIEHGTRNTRSAAMFDKQAGGPAHHPQAARCQRHRHRRPRQGADPRPASAGSRRASTSTVLTDRTTTIRASVHDMQFTLLLAIALVMLVVFVFLRRVTPTHRRRHHRAAVAGRHLRRHVGARLLASTISR